MATKVDKYVSLGPYGQGQMPRVGLGTFTVFGQRVCVSSFIAGLSILFLPSTLALRPRSIPFISIVLDIFLSMLLCYLVHDVETVHDAICSIFRASYFRQDLQH